MLKLTAIGAVLVGGLCAGSWVGVLVTERLAPACRNLDRQQGVHDKSVGPNV